MDDDDWDVDIDVDALVEQHRQRDAAAAEGSAGVPTSCAAPGNAGWSMAQPAAHIPAAKNPQHQLVHHQHPPQFDPAPQGSGNTTIAPTWPPRQHGPQTGWQQPGWNSGPNPNSNHSHGGNGIPPPVPVPPFSKGSSVAASLAPAPTCGGAGTSGRGQLPSHTGTSAGAQQLQQQQHQVSAALKAQQIRDRWAKPKAHRPGLDLHASGHIVKGTDGSIQQQQGRGWQPPASAAALNAVTGTGAPTFPFQPQQQQRQPSWQAVRPEGTAVSELHVLQPQPQHHHQQQRQMWDSSSRQAAAHAPGPAQSSGMQQAALECLHPMGVQQQQQRQQQDKGSEQQLRNQHNQYQHPEQQQNHQGNLQQQQRFQYQHHSHQQNLQQQQGWPSNGSGETQGLMPPPGSAVCRAGNSDARQEGFWQAGGSNSGPGTKPGPYHPPASIAPYQAPTGGAPRCAARASPTGAPPPQPDSSTCVGVWPPSQDIPSDCAPAGPGNNTGCVSGAEGEASLLDVPLQKRRQQRRSQPSTPTPGLQHQPNQQRGQEGTSLPAPPHPVPPRESGTTGPAATVARASGGSTGQAGSSSGTGYWESIFGAGARVTAARQVQEMALQPLRPPLLPAAGRANAERSPPQRKVPPLDVDDPEMARALLAGELVELPVSTDPWADVAGLDASKDAGWDVGSGASGSVNGAGRGLIAPGDGANPGMMLHDVHARTWLYPKDLPVREYQIALVRSALFHNTLVCLPTGLGKTLIAAVVMLNYYRWFPEGKIVFVAPTKPLVEQQMKACKEKTCIPKADIVQLTATRGPGEGRAAEWAARRVFFCTPQILENDVASGTCPKEKLVLLVVDECHRALGKAAPVAALQTLRSEQLRIRVVGLSATPGSNADSVQEVIRNLGISRVEFRSEEDPDVSPYCHKKQVDVIEVLPDDILRPVAESVVLLLRGVNAKLLQYKVVDRYDAENVGRFSFVSKMKQFQSSLPDNKSLDKTAIPKIYNLFNQAIFLATLLESITTQGAKMAADFVRLEVTKNGGQSLRDLMGKPEWKAVRQRLEECGRYTHPKMRRLEEVVLQHFGLHQTAGPPNASASTSPSGGPNDGGQCEDGDKPDGRGGGAVAADAEGEGEIKRVIIFTTLRDTVAEIVSCLERHAPKIVPRVFVGQGARGAGRATGGGGRGRGRGRGGRGAAAAAAATDGGEEGGGGGGRGGGGNGAAATAAVAMTMNQEEQRAVLQGFRDGVFNVLVATCIGEEGLDIPEVDLIVCYDSSASPTRQIQRMGRTGRHREGRVVYVLAAGKETDSYYRSQEEMRRLQALLRDAPRVFELSRSSPPMLPTSCHPRPVLLRLQAAAAAVTAHQKQQQAVAKKQTGKRAAGGGAAGAADGTGAPGGGGGVAKRRKGITSATDGGGGVGEKHLTVAQQAAAARWAKRPLGHHVITIGDDEYCGDAVGGDGNELAETGEDAEANMPLAQRVLARIRDSKQQQQQQGGRRRSSGVIPSLKPLWGSQHPLDGDEDASTFDWEREIFDTEAPTGVRGTEEGRVSGAKAVAGEVAGAAAGGRGYALAIGVLAPAAAGTDAVAAAAVAGDDNGAAGAEGSAVQVKWPTVAVETGNPEMPSASAAAAADGTPAISTPDALSGGQTRPEPHAIPDPSVPTADTTMVDVDVPPTAAVAGSPKPLRHIMSDLAPNAKGFDSRRPDGGIAASGLWLSPQLTTALHNLLLGPADHSTATAARSKDCGRPVDRPSPHHSTETPTRTVPKADTAPHEPVGFLEALLKPISDEEAAELVAAASNHPIARLAAAFKPQLLNYRPPPIARAPQLPEFLPAVRLVRAGPSSQGDSLRGTGAIGPSALCTSASTPREPNGETRRPVYEVGQRPKGQSIHQNASGNPTSPAVAVGARQPGCVAADHGQEVLELLSDDSASEPGGDRRGGHSVGRGNGGPDDGFDPDRLVMTLDVVPLAARKPTGHVARAKRDSTTRVSGWPSASKHSKLKRAGRAASASPRPQEAVAAVAATPATADDDDRLEDMPLAARKRLSAAAAAVATAAQPSPPSERDRKPAALAAYTSPGFCPNTSPENRREFNRGKSGYALHGNGPIEDRSTHQLHSAGPEAAGSCQPEGQVLKQGWQATPAPGAGEIHSVVGAGLGAAPGTGSGAPPHLFPGREAGDGARLDASSAPGYWPWDVQEGSRSREPLLGAAAARQPWQHAGQPFHGNDYSTDQRIQSPHQHQHQHHVYHAQDKQMQIPADAPPSQRQLQQRPLQPQQQHQQQSSGWQPQHQDSGWQPPPLQPPQQQQRNISWQQQPLEPPQQQQKSGWQPPQQQEQQQTSGWQHQPLQQPHQAQPQKTSWQQQALQRQQQQQKSDWQQQPQQPLPSPPQQQRQQQQQEQQQNSGWQQEMLQPPPPPQQQSSGWQPPPLQPPQQQQGQQQKSGWQQEMLQPPPPPQQQSSGWQPPPLQPPQQQQEQQQISCWQQEMLQPPPQQQQQSPGWQPPPLQPPQQQQEQQQKSGWQQEMLQPPPQQQQQQSSGWQPPPLQPPQQQQGQQQKSGWQQMLQPPPQQQQQQNYGWQPHRINVMAPATVQEQKQQQQQLDALAPGLKRASAGGSSTVHDATADPITAAAAAASPRMARELWATEDEEEIYIPATPLSDDGVELAHQCTDIGAGECARRAGEACAGSSDNVIAPVGSGGGDHAALPSPIKPRQLQFPAPTPSPNGQLLGPTATNLIATPGLEPELQPERASLPPWLALQARQQQRQQLPLPKRQAHDLQGGKPEAVPRSVREQQKVRGDAGGWTCGSESAGVDLCLMTGKRVLPVPELSRPPDAARQQGQQQRLEQQQMGESAIATRRGEPPALSHGLQKALDAMAAVDDNDGGGGDWSVVHADGPGTITAVRSAGDGSGAASATAVISPVAGPVAFQGAAVAADVATGSGDAPAVGTGGGSSRIHGNLEDGQAAMGLTHLDDQEHLHEPDSGLDDWLLQPWHQQKRQPEQSKGQDQQLHPPPEARRYQVDRSGNGGSGGSCRISNSALSFGSQFLAARPREHERLQQLTGVVPETPGLSDLADAAGEHGEGDGGDDNGSADCKAAGSRPSGGELASRSRGPFAAFAFHAAAGTGTGAGGGPSGASFRAPTAANITPIMRARLQRRTADAARPASGPTAATAVAAEEADVPPPPFTIDLTSSPPPSCERRQSAVTVAGHQENTAHVGQCPLSATSTEGAVVTRRHLCTKAGAAAVKRRVAVITDDSSQEPGSVRRKPAVDGKAAVGGYNNCAAGSDSGGSSRGSGSLFKKFALTPVGPAAGFGAAAAAGTRTPGIGDNPNGSAGGCGGRDTTPLVGLRRRVRRPVRTASDDGAAAAAADGDPGSGSIRKPRKLRRLQAGASGAGGSGFGATARCQHAYGRDGAATMTGDGSKAGNAPTSRRPAGPPAAAITAGASIAANRTRLLAAPAEAAATEGARPAGTIGGARGGWRRGACSFIDAEAALSGDEEEGEEGEEGEEEGYESSFVTDGSDGELAGGSQSEDAGARSPGSMMAIYRAPFLATQAPPSVVRPGDVAALVFAQRRRRRGGVPAAAQKGFPKQYGKILDTPGASADLNDSVSDGYGDDQSDGEADEGDQSADGEGEEDEEDEEGDDEDDGEDPLVRRMARGLDITRDGLYRRDSGLGRGGRGRGEGRGHDHHGLGSMRGAEDEEEAGEEGEGEAESDAGDDDVCGVCGEHGHLMVCEGCDSCVHPACVGLQAVPEGDWFCKLCRPQQRRPRGLGTVAGRPRSQGGCGGVGKGSLSEGTGSRR